MGAGPPSSDSLPAAVPGCRVKSQASGCSPTAGVGYYLKLCVISLCTWSNADACEIDEGHSRKPRLTQTKHDHPIQVRRALEVHVNLSDAHFEVPRPEPFRRGTRPDPPDVSCTTCRRPARADRGRPRAARRLACSFKRTRKKPSTPLTKAEVLRRAPMFQVRNQSSKDSACSSPARDSSPRSWQNRGRIACSSREVLAPCCTSFHAASIIVQHVRTGLIQQG
jgi:hypothetical protein